MPLSHELSRGVTGYKGEIDATRWLIAEVTHSFTEQGFTTGVRLETV